MITPEFSESCVVIGVFGFALEYHNMVMYNVINMSKNNLRGVAYGRRWKTEEL
jgi:hypothetical protein